MIEDALRSFCTTYLVNHPATGKLEDKIRRVAVGWALEPELFQ